MRKRLRQHIAIAVISAAVVLGLLGVLATTGGGHTTRQLLSQLERPARPAPATGQPFVVHRVVSNVRIALTLANDRADMPDPATVRITRLGGGMVADARVRLTYSMPSMGMWHVYASRLAPVASTPGTYRTVEGVLGMAGAWQIQVEVMPRSGRPARFVVSDPMRAAALQPASTTTQQNP